MNPVSRQLTRPQTDTAARRWTRTDGRGSRTLPRDALLRAGASSEHQPAAFWRVFMGRFQRARCAALGGSAAPGQGGVLRRCHASPTAHRGDAPRRSACTIGDSLGLRRGAPVVSSRSQQKAPSGSVSAADESSTGPYGGPRWLPCRLCVESDDAGHPSLCIRSSQDSASVLHIKRLRLSSF
jgi:hypothetical protein